MRLVHVSVPAGMRETVLRTLDDQNVDYVVSDETSGRDVTAVVSFPLPETAVEPVLDELREAGLAGDAFTVVVSAETVISRHFEELTEQYAETEDPGRISRHELQTHARDLAPTTTNYLVLTVVSVVIATAGLLLNSPSVVVGSMVIAPLIGPAMATSVGTVIDDDELFSRGLRLQVLGFVVAVSAATLFAFTVRSLGFVPGGLDVLAITEVNERITPDVLSLGIALGAGVAGAMSLRSGVSASLVGVMIAVALVPPVGVVGIGVAWWQPWMVLGATVLTLVNALSINFAAILVFWYSGYRPETWFRFDEARSATLKRVGVLFVALLVLSSFLGGMTFITVENAATEDEAHEITKQVVADIPDVTLVSFEMIHGENPILQRPETVVVTIGHPPGLEPPLLAEQLTDEFTEAGLDLRVQIRFVAVTEAG